MSEKDREKKEVGEKEWTSKWVDLCIKLRGETRYTIDRANAFYNSEEYEKATEKFKLLIKKLKRLFTLESPSEYDCRTMAYAYFRIFRYDKAKIFYQLAIKLHPKSHYAHNGLGSTYYRMFQYEEAIEEGKKAISLSPVYYLDAIKNLGNALYGLGRYQEEIDLYREAFIHAPKDLFLLNNCGYSLKELRKFDDAIEYFTRAMKIDEKYHYVYNGLGCVYKELKRYDEAIELFKKGIEIEPRYEKAYFNWGLTLIKTKKDFKQAEELIRKGINFNRITNKTDFYCSHCHGVALYKLNQFENAIQNFTNTLNRLPHIIYRYLTNYYHAMSLLKLRKNSIANNNNIIDNKDNIIIDDNDVDGEGYFTDYQYYLGYGKYKKNDNINKNNNDIDDNNNNNKNYNLMINLNDILEKLNDSINSNDKWSKGYYRRGEVYLMMSPPSLENAKSDFLNAIQFKEDPFPADQLSNKKIQFIKEKIQEIDSQLQRNHSQYQY